MKKYLAILFDVDGTLLDTSEGKIKSVEYTVDKLELRPLSEREKKSFMASRKQSNGISIISRGGRRS